MLLVRKPRERLVPVHPEVLSIMWVTPSARMRSSRTPCGLPPPSGIGVAPSIQWVTREAATTSGCWRRTASSASMRSTWAGWTMTGCPETTYSDIQPTRTIDRGGPKAERQVSGAERDKLPSV